MRTQIGVALILAVVAPFVVRAFFVDEFTLTPMVWNSLVGTAIATVVGGLFVRNFTQFPGIGNSAYVLPSTILPFGAVALILLLTRSEYSRSILFASLILSTIWYYFVATQLRRLRKMRIAVVPVGDVNRLSDIKGVDFKKLQSSELVDERYDAVAADFDSEMPEHWDRALADFVLSGIPVYSFKDLGETLTGRVRIDHLSENKFGSLAPLSTYIRLRSYVDRLAAVVFLLLFWPFLVIVGLAIKLDSKGPALFWQDRVGHRGQLFKICKFRTMSVSSDQDADMIDRSITQSGDHRITKLGKFLRRSRIDEIPQLFNILKGEMSWIGPRPEAEALSEWYESDIPFYRYRHVVPPGITGWAQVNQGHVAQVDEVHEKLRYDFYYIRHLSIWLDLLIVFKTVGTMISGFGHR